MKTVNRYALIVIFIIIVLVFWNIRLDDKDDYTQDITSATSFWTESIEYEEQRISASIPECTMQSCFDYSGCLNHDDLRVFVYPDDPNIPSSDTYTKLLKAIRESAYYTSDPTKACLFVLSIDTIDRDKISKNYIGDMDELINRLPSDIWNGGKNHVIFNLYHGTYPDYADHRLGFDTGEAIIARASPGVQHFRFGFDVSFPLFHQEHYLRSQIEREYSIPDRNEYLVSFKGKRYVYGIGSETRDSLHHLHNGDNVVMVTTCRHNNDWQAHQDDRCVKDNEEYERWDYESTMANSTFCLTPRGRRLGSYRFLESLRLGCIPIILSDDWVLPFSEFIDWSDTLFVVSEKNVLLVSDFLYSIPSTRITRMRQSCRLLYRKYLSSVENIALTTLKSVWERIRLSEALPPRRWNDVFPFPRENQLPIHVTLMLRAVDKTSSRLQRLIRTLSSVENIGKIVILWPSARGVAPFGADFGVTIPVSISLLGNTSNFWNLTEISSMLHGSHVLFMDERSNPTVKEINHLLSYTERNQERLIGLHALHVDRTTSNIQMENIYNSLFFSTVVMHRWYLTSLSSFLPKDLLEGCEAAAINVLTTQTLQQSPIVIGNRKKEIWMRFERDQACYRMFTTRWPVGLPLLYSDLRYV